MQITTTNELKLEPAATQNGVITKGNLQHIRDFNRWNDNIFRPCLEDYRDYLLTGRKLKATSVAVHLADIRRAYQKLLKNRDLLYSYISDEQSVGDRKAIADELTLRIRNSLDVGVSITKDDTIKGYRMSKEEASDFLAKFENNNKRDGYNKRDWLIVALMLATGIRISELVRITRQDLSHYEDGEAALLVRMGKGNKTRAVIWGGMYGLVDKLISYCECEGLIGKDDILFDMSTRNVEYIITSKNYRPAKAKKAISAHDLRRTYARLLYDNGMSTESIKDNMGHSNIETTLGHIGETDVKARRPNNIFGW